MEALVRDSLARQRFLLLLFGIFAGLALLLACIGIYGVLAYLTTQRVPEIGVRMALGARNTDVMWMVLRQSLGMILTGAALGAAGAFAAGRILARLVEGARPAEVIDLCGHHCGFDDRCAGSEFFPGAKGEPGGPVNRAAAGIICRTCDRVSLWYEISLCFSSCDASDVRTNDHPRRKSQISSARSHRQTFARRPLRVDGARCARRHEASTHRRRSRQRDPRRRVDRPIPGGRRLSIRGDPRSGGSQTRRRSSGRPAPLAGSDRQARTSGSRISAKATVPSKDSSAAAPIPRIGIRARAHSPITVSIATSASIISTPCCMATRSISTWPPMPRRRK